MAAESRGDGEEAEELQEQVWESARESERERESERKRATESESESVRERAREGERERGSEREKQSLVQVFCFFAPPCSFLLPCHVRGIGRVDSKRRGGVDSSRQRATRPSVISTS